MENNDFENATVLEKIETLRSSEAYLNPVDKYHDEAVKMMLELSQQYNGEPSVLPDDLNDLLKHPALNNRMHPDHKRAHQRFMELHGLK